MPAHKTTITTVTRETTNPSGQAYATPAQYYSAVEAEQGMVQGEFGAPYGIMLDGVGGINFAQVNAAHQLEVRSMLLDASGTNEAKVTAGGELETRSVLLDSAGTNEAEINADNELHTNNRDGSLGILASASGGINPGVPIDIFSTGELVITAPAGYTFVVRNWNVQIALTGATGGTVHAMNFQTVLNVGSASLRTTEWQPVGIMEWTAPYGSDILVSNGIGLEDTYVTNPAGSTFTIAEQAVIMPGTAAHPLIINDGYQNGTGTNEFVLSWTDSTTGTSAASVRAQFFGQLYRSGTPAEDITMTYATS